MEPQAPFMAVNGFGDLSVRKSRELQLSVRELQILQLLRGGLQTKEIGEQLGLRAGTVNSYLRDIYQKIGVGNRLELGYWIAQHLPKEPVLPLVQNE